MDEGKKWCEYLVIENRYDRWICILNRRCSNVNLKTKIWISEKTWWSKSPTLPTSFLLRVKGSELKIQNFGIFNLKIWQSWAKSLLKLWISLYRKYLGKWAWWVAGYMNTSFGVQMEKYKFNQRPTRKPISAWWLGL